MSDMISASSRYHHIWPAGWLWEVQLAGKLLHRPFLQLAVRRRHDPVSHPKIHLSGAGGASQGLRYYNLVMLHTQSFAIKCFVWHRSSTGLYSLIHRFSQTARPDRMRFFQRRAADGRVRDGLVSKTRGDGPRMLDTLGGIGLEAVRQRC